MCSPWFFCGCRALETNSARRVTTYGRGVGRLLRQADALQAEPERLGESEEDGRGEHAVAAARGRA